MRVVNWNVNSVRARAARIENFLHTHDVDVLLIQETKCRDAQFPYSLFESLGYEVAHLGLSQWNGVAIASRVGLEDVLTQFPGQPGFHKDPTQEQALEARAIGALCNGVRVWSLYVPNGREIADPHYDYKLRWLYALNTYVEQALEDDVPLILGGDYNIAPLDRHVWDIAAFAGLTHVTEPERQAFDALRESGLTVTSPWEGYSYWDYKGGRFQKNEGMLIDFQLASVPAQSAMIDVQEREGQGASDHAPVIVDYKLP